MLIGNIQQYIFTVNVKRYLPRVVGEITRWCIFFDSGSVLTGPKYS